MSRKNTKRMMVVAAAASLSKPSSFKWYQLLPKLDTFSDKDEGKREALLCYY